MVAVAPSRASSAFDVGGILPDIPRYSSGGSIRLLRGLDGKRRSVRYAEVARVNPWVAASINARAGVASRVPLHVFRPDPEGREGHRQRVRPGDGGPGDTLARLLATPEPGISGRKWRRRLLGDVLTHGCTLAEFIFSGSQIVELRWQPWVDVVPKLSEDGLRVEVFKVPVARRVTDLGYRQVDEMRVVDVADTLLLTIGDDTETPLGVSPLASLHATHALHDAAWRFARSYLEEGMFPTGVVELPAQATIAQAMVTRELLEELYVGPDRAGKPAVIGFGKWQQVMATPEGAKLVELAKASRDEVGAAYRSPLTVLGDLSAVNKASSQTAREQWIRDVVGEDVNVLETEIQTQVVGRSRRWSSDGIHIEGQLAEMLRPDMVELSKVIQREVGAPVLTPNDGRRLINYPPLPDPRADELVFNPGTPTAPDDDEEREPPEDE